MYSVVDLLVMSTFVGEWPVGETWHVPYISYSTGNSAEMYIIVVPDFSVIHYTTAYLDQSKKEVIQGGRRKFRVLEFKTFELSALVPLKRGSKMSYLRQTIRPH